MPNNIFFTGPRNIGKTTLVNKLLNELEKPLGGFYVTCEEKEDGRIFYLNDYLSGDRYKMATSSAKKTPQIEEGIFDRVGVTILKRSFSERKLIILDELGFMEESSFLFQEEVHKLLDSQTLVVGVLKAYDGAFIHSIESRKDVLIYEVTEENRDELYPAVLNKIDRVTLDIQF